MVSKYKIVMKPITPERSLSHNDRRRGDNNRLMPIVKEALMQKVWLYNKLNGEWYTPEEFQAKYAKANVELNNYEIREMLENMVMRDPQGGNIAYHKAFEQLLIRHQEEINELISKGQAFFNKVIGYYQNKK